LTFQYEFVIHFTLFLAFLPKGYFMAFPITHLLVAGELLAHCPRAGADAAQFMLGALAPDAVHYREGYAGAAMNNIGSAKKITHLCPVSDERWGAVTDNGGWVNNVRAWLRGNHGPFADGYAVHVLTDIHNNMTLWERFRTLYPGEAAKGYASDYYRDLYEIDLRLYLAHVKDGEIERLLATAKPCEMPGLVTAGETGAIRDNILYENYKGRTLDAAHEFKYITCDDTLGFVADAVDAILGLRG